MIVRSVVAMKIRNIFFFLICSVPFASVATLKAPDNCSMSMPELQEKRAALRRAVACEYHSDQCNEILGLGKVAAGAAAAVTIKKAANASSRLGKSIRNPLAKLCEVSKAETDFWQVVMYFAISKAYAASCSRDIYFLNQDLDRSIQAHTRDLKAKMSEQKSEIQKLAEMKKKTREQLAKELGMPVGTSEEKLLQEAEVRSRRQSGIHSVRPIPSMSAQDFEKKSLIQAEKLARVQGQSSPPGSPENLKWKEARAKVLQAFNGDGNAVNEFINRQNKSPASTASASGSSREALQNLSEDLAKMNQAETRMRVNQNSLSKRMMDWEFYKSKQGLPKDLAGSQKLFMDLFKDGADVSGVEARLTATEMRAGVRGGTSMWRAAQVGARTVAKVGIITAGAALGGVAMASDFVSSSVTACGMIVPSYLSEDKDCNLDYSITEKNADLVFSDTLGENLMESSPQDKMRYMCFIKANWESRFGTWKTICKPGPKDTGKFPNKIYVERADGKKFYFQNSENPAAIYGSVPDKRFLAQAYEVASCCHDSNPRVSDRECARYGVKMNLGQGSIQNNGATKKGAR